MDYRPMQLVRIIQMIPWFLLTVTLVISGCGASDTASLAAGPFTLAPGMGLDVLPFGASEAQTIAVLGDPESRFGEGKALYYPSKGLDMLFDSQTGRLAGIAVRAPAQVTTKEGIKLGSTREEIVAAYGEPDKAVLTPLQEKIAYTEIHANFHLEKGKVVLMGFFR